MTGNVEGYTIRAEPAAYKLPAWHGRWRRNDWPASEWATVESKTGYILYASTGAALTAAKDAATAHRERTFKVPKYPGSTVFIARFTRGNEFGDVRVQDYMDTTKSGRYQVGTFLPGVVEWSPGDTAKVWPERRVYAPEATDARMVFDMYCLYALAEGWKPLLVPGKGNH